MHLQLTKVRSGRATKRYARLVQSYRRDDGMPVHRVLANLGELSDQEIANFRLALEASRNAKSVVLPEAPKWRAKVLANLDYLDVAVALELWRGWELSELLHQLIAERDVAVRAAEVICALTIQRCVAPGSKLYAQRWFPRTALPERTQDGKALHDLVETIEGKEWARGVPIVFDRAMGSAGAVARLCKSELRFLTAVRRSEIHSYTEELPSETLADLGGSEDEVERKRLITEACMRVSAAGMQKVDEQLYVLDLGTTTRGLRLVSDIEEPDVNADKLEGGALWLYRARAYRAQLEDKTFKTQSEIAKHLGVTRARMTQIMTLIRLDEALQKEVLAGNYGYVADRTLRAIAALRTKAAQRRALVEHGQSARPMDPSQKPKCFQHKSTLDASLRLVLYFNPQMFVDMRAMGDRHRAEVDAYVRDLHARLRRKGNKATRESVYSDITVKLASRSMLSIYTVQIDQKEDDGHEHFVVSLAFDEAAWNKRRSADGFVLLVAHADLPQSATEMVALYRARDAVEKDFQTIRSDLKLLPVFHHTDPKVRAHVSLCMLALLLERTLERRLRKAGKAITAPAAFEELAAGHLNMVATGPDDSVAYVATEPRTEQRELLARLRLEHIVDQEQMAARIEPRPAA